MSTAEHILGRFGIRLERTVTEGQGSEIMYRTSLGCFNNGDIVFPQHEELLTQLRWLSETTSDGNRFKVSERRNSKDDLAVSCVLSIAMAAEPLEKREPIAEAIFVTPGGTSGYAEDRCFVLKCRIPSFSKPGF
jgi:hypothetical protein